MYKIKEVYSLFPNEEIKNIVKEKEKIVFQGKINNDMQIKAFRKYKDGRGF